ncbi:MAG: TIGR03663 family protein [Halobacteriovoraceae bacterium]|jgi:uncharacterized protein (TIGR03663 family)|nr:TIGR03663 family protein [Halobacteriovoraceae bacterium]MBT5093928.1 TIGR03663 family protein [Halobacteriovoraceae bacterium]
MESTKTYFNRQQNWIYLILIFAGLLLRWINLDQRPLHHDESLHGIYGLYFYDNPATGFYKYNPLLHGPFLYHLLPFSYELLGVSKFAMRFPMAFIGSAMLFIPWIYRRYFNPKTALILTAAIALSPTLIYWSRFVRHDFLVLSCWLAMLFAITHLKGGWRNFVFISFFSLQFTIKENSYITFGLLLAYLFYEATILKIVDKYQESYLSGSLLHIKRSGLIILFSLLSGVIIYCYFYSAGFQYLQGILDGLYRKSLVYWADQHSKSRIPGPFIYQFMILSWYQAPFILLLLYQTFNFYVAKSWSWKWPALLALTVAICLRIAPSTGLIEAFKWQFSMDHYLFLFLLLQGIVVTTWHILKREKVLAFFCYGFFSCFFTYSYVGEKVPWLALYPFVMGLIYFALYFDKNIFVHRRRQKYFTVALLAFCLWSLRISLITNYSRAGKASEYLAQVHTSKEYEEIAKKIVTELDAPHRGIKPTILNYRENNWPLSWYLYGRPEYVYLVKNHDPASFDYIFDQPYDPALHRELSKTHRKILIDLREWWVPDLDQMTLLNFTKYALTHNPWNPIGFKKVALFIKKSRSNELQLKNKKN